MTFWSLIRRGLLVGALAGLCAGLFALGVAEPNVQKAIDHEDAMSLVAAAAPTSDPSGEPAGVGAAAAAPAPDGHAHTHGEDGEEEVVVSRPNQRAGMVLATTLSGIVFGGLLGLAFALRVTRRGGENPWTVGLAMGGTAAFALIFLPLVVYPANPPGIGNPDTINTRTIAYLVLVIGGLVAGWVASRAVRSVRREDQPWRAPLAAIGVLLAMTIALKVILPGSEPAPETFPAQLLWNFRLSALATQVVLWSLLSIGFAAVISRAYSGAAAKASGPVAAGASAPGAIAEA